MRDSDGYEYTTFRESIGEQAGRLEGQRAPDEPGGGEGDTDPDEAAWRTAVEAAPWPFKERVAEDIKEDD